MSEGGIAVAQVLEESLALTEARHPHAHLEADPDAGEGNAREVRPNRIPDSRFVFPMQRQTPESRLQTPDSRF